jgi:hypothetical protein
VVAACGRSTAGEAIGELAMGQGADRVETQRWSGGARGGVGDRQGPTAGGGLGQAAAEGWRGGGRGQRRPGLALVSRIVAIITASQPAAIAATAAGPTPWRSAIAAMSRSSVTIRPR